MKKLLNFLLIITSLVGYLQWGGGNHAFLGQVEWGLITRATGGSDAFMHPFVIIPLLGQLLLLFTMFQRTPGKVLTYAGLACLSIIMLFLLFIGITAFSLPITLSAIPFVLTGIVVISSKAYR